MHKRKWQLLVPALLVFALFAFAACTPAAQPTAAPPTAAPQPTTAAPQPTQASSALAEYKLPDYYPADYAKIIEACKNEKDGLLVYSIMSETNWKPILEAFKAKYPWVEAQALDLGSYEVFERYYSESASNARTGDIIITSTPDGWQEFIAKGELAANTSPEDGKVPQWSKLAPNIYSASSDPMIMIYNKQLVKGAPSTMADFAKLIAENPSAYAGKVTTYDAEKNATGFAINWFWLKQKGDEGWKTVQAIGGTKPTLQTSAGNMVNATLSGEAALGYFVSAISVYPKFPAAEPVLGYSFIKDGQPILVRGMGITKHAKSPNCAKLLVDFIISSEGQIALSKGGLTPYRDDIADKVDRHLKKIAAEVGEENMIYFTFDPELLNKDKKAEFVKKWLAAMGR